MSRLLTPAVFLLVFLFSTTATAANGVPPGKSAPVNTSLPTISGTTVQGQTLTATAGSWQGPTPTYAYQWNRCASTGSGCALVAGATSATYVLSAADVGSTLRVAATAGNKNGSTIATSNATSIVTAPVTGTSTAPAPTPTPTPTPSPTPSPTPTPTPTGTQSFLSPFASGSLWNTPLPSGPTVDPSSADKISYWLTKLKSPNMTTRSYGVATAQASNPFYTITCTVYACPNMNSFGLVPIPSGTQADPGSDHHLSVWDPATHVEWDFWGSQCPLDCAHTASGGATDTDSLVPWMPSEGANAVRTPLLGGLVRPEEIAAGAIEHPLAFATVAPGTAAVCPARKSDGSDADPRSLPEGSLLQLDPSVDVSSLPISDWEKTLARAMQKYGMYLVDSAGSGPSIRGENPINRGDLWTQAGLTGTAAYFSSTFPWNRMRVLAPPKPWC